jgi:iron complex outermembrane receptor protein
MRKIKFSASLFVGSLAYLLTTVAFAELFNIPAGDLKGALDVYAKQTGVELVVSAEALNGARTKGAKGELSPDDALTHILAGTGFVVHRHASGAIGITRDMPRADDEPLTHIAAAPTASAPGAALETVTVTSSKIGGDVQNIPISITALSQEQLTATQTAGGPDLVKQVPNMTFTKTNFTGYSIQLRGIGTQAISVTTDPAVAVAFNDIPFIRNHFFEQEFYDVSQVEVLRGPQGTLYGRNATAGVVNLISAKPTDQFEAMASLDVGNYGERRPEGMINFPVVDDRLDIRVAGEWTKRQGYSFNEITGDRVDGRDLWSGRVSIAFKPFAKLQTSLVWEHFSEDDDRMRTSKQLCKTAPIPATVNGAPVPPIGSDLSFNGAFDPASYLSQSCELTSLYSPDAFEVPEGYALGFIKAAKYTGEINATLDPYAETTQSKNLRVIQTTVNPAYKAKNDVVEFNADYAVTPALTFTSQTGFNHDFLWSTEDYNRFDTSPGIFDYQNAINQGQDQRGQLSPDPLAGTNGIPASAGVFCDPQLGCSDRLVAQDLADEHAWQLSQEFRLASNFSGPFNFSVGGNYLHYETEENYYVFINTLTLYSSADDGPSSAPWVSGVSDNHECLDSDGFGFLPVDPRTHLSTPVAYCNYIDPNPISKVNNEGHNYFLSQNPYTLNSYAAFGEAYYNVLPDLKLTTGLRWTEDQKHFTDIPSELLTDGWGYFQTGAVNQQWDQFTGRAAVNWAPKLDFTDQTLVYASYAHGYKAGGANPPGAVLIGNAFGNIELPDHPLTFKPEFIDAFELGSKNTLLDGSLTLNADVFYYNYENYQISEIVDRTAINNNYDAHVKGAEVEATWEPVPGLRFNFAGGWEDTALAKGANAIDLMDRTAGNPNWIVVKPYPTQASNCILPTYVVAATFQASYSGTILSEACGVAYSGGETGAIGGSLSSFDPVTQLPYVPNPTVACGTLPGQGCTEPAGPIPAGYPGFNPATAPNDGEGFSKDLSGNKLPNAPPFTVSFGTQYTIPLTTDWAGTLRGDYYWQDYSWARVFNDNPYDRLRGYTNVNLTLIFTNQNGWQVMLYDKNIFNETAITGDFLNSDDSGLTTNVFLTDPKLIGIRVTKNW